MAVRPLIKREIQLVALRRHCIMNVNKMTLLSTSFEIPIYIQFHIQIKYSIFTMNQPDV